MKKVLDKPPKILRPLRGRISAKRRRRRARDINFIYFWRCIMSKKEICNLIVSSIKDLLGQPAWLTSFKAPKHFVRNRLLSMLHVIIFLLFSNSSSMDNNLSNIKRKLQGSIEFPKVTKQAISHARQAISPMLFSELFNLSVDLFYNNISNRKTWNNLHVFAIDGSKFELPNSSKNFETFGEMFVPLNPNSKFSQSLVSIVYDVTDDYIVHASMNRYLSSERDAAIEHMDTLESLGIYKDSVVVFDRGYYSEAMFRYCVSHNHKCVMRLKESLNFSKSAGKKNSDFTDVLPGNPKEGTEDIPIRIISVKLKTGEYEYLATNIFTENFTYEMFKKLYFMRWPIEMKYHELKERLNIEDFIGATPVAIMQEFFIKLLLSNLAALLKGEADEEIQSNDNKANKYRYHSNRSFIIGQIKEVFPMIVFGLYDISEIQVVFEDACTKKVPTMPNRSCPRKKKKDNKHTHFRNRKPAF